MNPAGAEPPCRRRAAIPPRVGERIEKTTIMNKKLAVGLAGAFAIAVTTSGCWKDSSSDAAKTEPVPEAPAAPAPAPTVTSKPAKVDPVAAADRKAGLAAIASRVVATGDAYEKVAPRQDDRYSLHPDTGKNASIEFDVKGLQSLTLSPYMADFSTIPDCDGNPEAGVVRMRWSLDGGALNEVTVDRNYTATIAVDTSKASRLKVEADEANGVHWCDWFGLGVVNVE